MRVAIHLKPHKTTVNERSACLGRLLEARGHKVTWTTRDFVVPTDLTIQTCFAPSVALKSAIEHQIPFLVMEAPYFRTFYDKNHSAAWGYNGLAGGSWRPDPPIEARPKPELQPMRDEGKTLIIGQKPTDISLRGSDHIQWLLDRFDEFPEADFRPHPLMIYPRETFPSIEEALVGYKQVITYNSTVGVDATIAGCEVRVDGPCSLAPKAGVSREEWIHDLSWSMADYTDFEALVDNILSGYEEARERMRSGLHELAQVKPNGRAIQEQYHKSIIRGYATRPPQA
jgi:hypothetical protein